MNSSEHPTLTDSQSGQHPPKKIIGTTFRRGLMVLLAASLLVVGAGVVFVYLKAFRPSVHLAEGTEPYLLIPTGSDYQHVLEAIRSKGCVSDPDDFDWTARQKKYPAKVRPGRYKLVEGMSNHELVNLLRSGRQEPVQLVVTEVRTRRDLAGKIARQIEADSASLVELLTYPEKAGLAGYDSNSVVSLLIPNTYEMFWNTTATGFIERMVREHRIFWNEERISKAAGLGLSPEEVAVLASIVQSESNQGSELARIAGVYLNRLKTGRKLEADPTVVFATGDFSIRRVLKRHLAFDSPFNTYLYAGLPPGPIAVAGIRAIEAVLNPEKHNFYYFCAREDFSGYHNFATTEAQHIQNARKYSRELNKRRILK